MTNITPEEVAEMVARLRDFYPHEHELEVVDEAADMMEALAAKLAEVEVERDAAVERSREASQYLAIETNHAEAAEAENARLVDAIKDTVLFLDQMHTARMTGLGRDPVKYTSELSTHRDKLAALTTKEQNK
jgi:hypothetical protein